MAKFFELSFAEKNEYIILPETSLHHIINAVQKGHSGIIKINIEMLLPAGYIQYVVNMANANREHEMFRYQYLHKDNIESKDILLILSRQLGLLMIEGVRCFAEVSFGKYEGWIHYTLKINPEASAYFMDNRKVLIIREYNRSEVE